MAVVCGDKAGILDLKTNQVCCSCAECLVLPEDERRQSANMFEKHGGGAAAHKWRQSIRVVEGLPEGALAPHALPIHALPLD